MKIFLIKYYKGFILFLILQGKLVVIGSSLLLADSYVDKEDNSDVSKFIFSFLLGNDVNLNQIDAEDPDIADYTFVPSLTHLVGKPRVCLQQPTVVCE